MSLTLAQGEERRFLIAVGSPTTPGLPELPRVKSDVERVVEMFCGPSQGYTRVLADQIPPEPTALGVRNAIYDWFTDEERRATDVVMMYFAGHGGDAGRAGKYYLFTKDTDERKLAQTAIDLAEMLTHLFEGSGERPQNLLLVVDACYSARGGGDILAALSQIRRSGFFREGTGIWLVSSADPMSEAGDGAFVTALGNVLADPAWAPAGGAQHLEPLDIMVAGVNDYYMREAFPQTTEGDVFGMRKRARFIRNPRHTGQRDGVPLLDESHWDPRGRGVEGLASTGWYFTGRQSALRALTSWLEARASDRKARVVTGAPGSGKSAVLARLVLSVHPGRRMKMIESGVLDPSDGTAPHEGFRLVYVHARGLSREEIAGKLASQLMAPDNSLEGLLRTIRDDGGPLGMVVDALDEAADPLDLEVNLLRPLADAPSVRLVVGTRRRGTSVPLAGAAVELDLDAPPYFAREDFESYVVLRLTQWDPPTPYRDSMHRADAARLAQHVVQRAGVSFLFTRLVTRALAASRAAIDTRVPNWQATILVPNDLRQVFELDLRRFQDSARNRIVDLLLPLAYARGKGLPQKNIWASVASHIAGRNYGNHDIRDLHAKAGYYIVQDTDQDEVVYRLFHQEFADYLQTVYGSDDVEAAFVRGLRSATMGSAEANAWSALHDRYALNYIASHAASAGMLDALVRQAAFLIHIPPESLLPHLHGLEGTAARRHANIYRGVSHRMRSASIEERASYLHLASLQDGATEFAREVAGQGANHAWQALWALWASARRVPGEVAIESRGQTDAVAVHQMSTDQALVALGVEGAVHAWSLPGHTFLGSSPEFPGTVAHVFILDLAAHTWLIGVWMPPLGTNARESATARVMEYPSMRVHAESPVTLEGRLRAASVGGDNDKSYLALSSDDQLAVYPLPSLAPGRYIASGHWTRITCISLYREAAGPVLVASFDSCRDGRYCGRGILTRKWSVQTLKRVADKFHKSRGTPRTMTAFSFQGEQWIALQYTTEFDLAVLDSSLRTRAYVSGTAFDFAGALEDGQSTLIFGNKYGKFCFARVSRALDGAIDCEVQQSEIDITGEQITGPAKVHGRVVLASIYDRNRICLWDVDEMMEVARSRRGSGNWPDGVSSSFGSAENCTGAVFDSENSRVFLSFTSGRVEAIDAIDGTPCWRAQPSRPSTINGIALAKIEGRTVVVAATSEGVIHLLNALDGMTAGPEFHAGGDARCLEVAELNGRPICFVAVQDGSRYRVLAFDLALVGRVPSGLTPVEPQLEIDGYENKTIWRIRLLPRQGPNARVLMAGPYSFVRMLEWPSTRWGLWDDLEMGERNANMYVKDLAVGQVNGREVAVAGNENGLLACWDLETRERLGSVRSAHNDYISVVAVFSEPGLAPFVSGGSGRVLFWTERLEKQLEIDFEAHVVAILPLGEFRFFVATEKGMAVVALGTTATHERDHAFGL